ncbi:MlaA family lipoprotein [Marinivivus vitaminiproducens]|uniref:MlaA family lipoprotein n=1 Tax=Marinivivus vitaminiproducens TaxID=3035935 RepID=UPI0027991FDB|nr:VacJ family lipoprotein [Geminicoccaceae bacterium SCSIO 64248]
MIVKRSWRRLGLLVALALLLSACAGQRAASGGPDIENDPIEPVNRAVFEFNQVIDGMFVEPAAIMYRDFIPTPARDRVRDFLDNLRQPFFMVNHLLQGEGGAALDTFGRFMTNTMLGGAGLFDVASAGGMPATDWQDYGITLGKWGVPDGPYLMLPLLGPSNPRDLTGTVTEFLVGDPLFVALGAPLGASIGRTAAETVDFREQNLEQINSLKESTFDLYATLRSAYRQRRAARISGQGAADADIYDEQSYGDDAYADPLAEPTLTPVPSGEAGTAAP